MSATQFVSLSETVIKLCELMERMDKHITLAHERITTLNELVQIMNAQLECLKKQVDVQALFSGSVYTRLKT